MKGLCLDGGGSLGIGQAKILDAVDITKFDFLVGTSIGAANAAVCAMQLELPLTSFFHNEMPSIFGGHWWRQYKPITPRYNDDNLNRALRGIFDSVPLGNVKRPLFITSVDIDSRKLKVFDSNDATDACMPLWEVVRS